MTYNKAYFLRVYWHKKSILPRLNVAALIKKETPKMQKSIKGTLTWKQSKLAPFHFFHYPSKMARSI